MKTKNFLMLIALASVMVFASCSKDDPKPLSTEDAITTLESVDGDYLAIRGEYEANPSAIFMSEMEGFDLPWSIPMKTPYRPQSIKEDFAKTIKPALSKVKGVGIDDIIIDFPFNERTGTWTYGVGSWNHTTTPSDMVVIILPYKEGTATLTFYDYKTGTYLDSGETITYITQLKFKAEIAGQDSPILSWTYTASMGLTSANAKFVYNIGNFTQTQSFSLTSAYTTSTVKMTFSLLFEIQKNSSVVYSTSANMVVSESDISGLKMAIEAKVRVMNIVIKWEINIDEDTDTSNPNNFMLVSVWTTSGAKVADVVLIWEEIEYDYVAYFKYSDGSMEKVESKLNQGLYEDLGDFIDNLMSFGLKK